MRFHRPLTHFPLSFLLKKALHPSNGDETMRRSRTEHLIAVLEACQKPQTKVTHIFYRANLDGNNAYALIAVLVERKLLDKTFPMQKWSRKLVKHPVYHTNEEGKRIVRVYREVEGALSEAKS